MAATGDTTGRRGIFLSNPAEWTQILASYSLAYSWTGLEVGFTHPMRMAIVSSRLATHQSSIVSLTVRDPLEPTLRLDATDALADTVSALNTFRPQALVGYASMLQLLAEEQRAGRLAVMRNMANRGDRVPGGEPCRQGGCPPIVEVMRADMAQPAEAIRACRGAAVVYHCANPPYHRLPELHPPFMDAIIEEAS